MLRPARVVGGPPRPGGLRRGTRLRVRGRLRSSGGHAGRLLPRVVVGLRGVNGSGVRTGARVVGGAERQHVVGEALHRRVVVDGHGVQLHAEASTDLLADHLRRDRVDAEVAERLGEVDLLRRDPQFGAERLHDRLPHHGTVHGGPPGRRGLRGSGRVHRPRAVCRGRGRRARLGDHGFHLVLRPLVRCRPLAGRRPVLRRFLGPRASPGLRALRARRDLSRLLTGRPPVLRAPSGPLAGPVTLQGEGVVGQQRDLAQAVGLRGQPAGGPVAGRVREGGPVRALPRDPLGGRPGEALQARLLRGDARVGPEVPVGRGLARRVAVQRGPQARQVPGDHGQPYGHGGAAGAGGVGQVGERGPRSVVVGADEGVQVVHPSAGVRAQRRLVPGGEHEQLLSRWRGRRLGTGGSLRQHQVDVAAARPEGADAGGPGGAVGTRRPGGGLALDPHGRVLEVDVRVGLVRVQRRCQAPVVELEEHLGHRGDPGGALQVPDRGLHRPDRTPVRPGSGERLPQSLDLDRVAQRGAGPVRLQVVDPLRPHTRVAQRGPHGPRLSGGARHGEAAGAPGVVDGAAPDDRVHVVAVPQGLPQRLEQDRADALAGDVSGAAPAEGPAAPVVGEEPALRELKVLLRVDDEVDPAGQRRLALARADAAYGQVERGEGRRAGGVQGHAGSAQVEGVRDPVGHGRVRRHRGDAVVGGVDQLVVVPHHADEHAHGASGERAGRMAGVLQRVPGGHQEQPLLRIHPFGVPP